MGGSMRDVRPFNQHEVNDTYNWIKKTIFPKFGLVDTISAKPIGSFLKKSENETSGDIDIAVHVDTIAGFLGCSLDEVLDKLNDILSKDFDTKIARGLKQISFAVPISSNIKNGLGQIDFMLTDNMDWSEFIYHSPDFKKNESKYKGLYRNILLMKIISNINRKDIEVEDGQTVTYTSYVIRLNQGIVEVTKTFKGKRGLTKAPKLLNDLDKFITNTPEEVARIAFGDTVTPNSIMSFEGIWEAFTSNKFIHKNKFSKILSEYIKEIKKIGVPIPIEISKDYKYLLKESRINNLQYIKTYNEFKNK